MAASPTIHPVRLTPHIVAQMIRLVSALPLAALLASAPLAAQAARDFQLPPAPAPTDTRVQGPVDTDAVVPVRPRAIETAPAATPTPAPTAAPSPSIALPASSRTRPATAQPVPARTASVQAAPTVAPTLAPPLASPGGVVPAPLSLPAPAPAPAPALATAPSASATPSPTSGDEPTAALPWLWIALGAAVLGAACGIVWWRRRNMAPPAVHIVTPHVAAASPHQSHPAEALAIGVEAVRLDRSVLNATVGYRVTIRNRTSQALNGVAIEADLVSASRDRPAEQQIAVPDQALTPRHATERLAPGQSVRFEGQVRLPLSEASAIWQGRVGLLVPLLRVRAIAAGATPVATTLVIGRAEGSTSRPQPFRLDEPPRSYTPLAQRVLDAVPARA